MRLGQSLSQLNSPDRPASVIPFLESGDRLSRAEFERRYQAMPYLKKAELIEGVVYVASPLRFESHAEPHSNLITWLVTYKSATPGVRVGDNPTVRLDLDNEPQPDAVLLIDESAGGQTRISEDDYVEGAPELVVEIAASSASIDLNDKKRVYRRNGVLEYIVWRVLERQVDWFRLEAEEYVKLESDSAGVLKSQIFPGLWLAVDPLIADDMARVLAVLQEGIQSPAHRAFLAQLAQPK